jgi:hypothetical protein
LADVGPVQDALVTEHDFHEYAILVVLPSSDDDDAARLLEVPVVARPGDATTCARVAVFASLVGTRPTDADAE